MADPIPTEAFYDVTRVTPPAVSPSGDRAAFVASESDPDEDRRRNSVFVVPTDGSRDPHRLTRVSDAGDPVWSPDGSRLGVVMAREEDVERTVGRDEDDEDDPDPESEDGPDAESEDGSGSGEDDDDDGGGDEPKPQVWVYDLELGGDARQVTDFDEGVQGFDWGPDGDRVVVSARDPTDDQAEYLEEKRDGGPIEVERLQHKRDGQGWLDDVQSYLFVVDVATGDRERIDETGLPSGGTLSGGSLSPAWGPGGRIAFGAYDPDAGGNDRRPDDTYVRDLYTIEPDGSDRRRVTDGDVVASDYRWSPGGDRITFAGGHPENFYRPTEVYVADPEDGEYRSVSGELDRTLSWFGSPRWLDDDALVALVGDEARTRFVRLPVEGAPERVPAGQGDHEAVRGFDLGTDGRVVAVRSAPAEGTDLFAFDAADLDSPDADWTRLSAVNADLLGEYDFPECRRLTFESPGVGDDDAAEVEAIAYYPDDFDPEDPDPRRFLLWIHGGPMAYDEPGFAFDDGVWTSRGYVVWKVNYRGSTSYGREFCESLRGRWNSVEVVDLLTAVDEAVDRGWADPDRLFVGGFSQGGINTAYLLTRTDRFAAGAAEHGIYDARSAFGTDDCHVWWESDYGLPWENPEEYDSASSIDDVDEVDTPTLVTAGENDWRCPPSQAEQFYVGLRKRGVPAKLVIYQGEHHDVGDPDRAIHRLDTLSEWFDDHDPAEGDDTAEGDESAEGDDADGGSAGGGATGG